MFPSIYTIIHHYQEKQSKREHDELGEKNGEKWRRGKAHDDNNEHNRLVDDVARNYRQGKKIR